mgnify:CR=1 FL=1
MTATAIAALVAWWCFGLLVGRHFLPRLPTAPDRAGAYRTIRLGHVEVRRYGDEVDEVVLDDHLHVEVMAQPSDEDPEGERYAAISIIAWHGQERVQVEATSATPIRLIVLEPEGVACR